MKIGVNSDLNIPVRRSTQKHNFGRGAVKLPHSGVERKHIEVGTSENKATENPAKQQAETKETGVVKSASGAGGEAGAKLGESQAQNKDCFNFSRDQFECFDYCRRWVSLVSFQMRCCLAKK